MSRWSIGGAWLSLLALAGVIRVQRAGAMRPNPAEERELFRTPLEHPPLLDVLTAFLAPDRRLVIAVIAGVIAVLFVGLLVRRTLGDAGALLAMALAAFAPPMVFLGSWWSHESLTIALASGTALFLIHVLDEGPSPARLIGLGVTSLLLTSSAWAGIAPLLAWTAWLGIFAPWWLEPERARSAAAVLGVASVVTLLGYSIMMLGGSDPQGALGWARLPSGLAALQSHVDSIAAMMLGRVGHYPRFVRLALAVMTVGLVGLGWRRTAPMDDGQSCWASVLLVGSAGGFAIALFIHPWIPIAVEKSLWYCTPMLVCLSVAGLWPRNRVVRRLAPLLLLGALAVGCTDEDEDGVSVQAGDCDDRSAAVYPNAPEVWGDLVDNDCDGIIDDSSDYRYIDEAEPNDTLLSGCFAPAGQPLGDIAPFGLLNRLSGDISDVVEDSYEEGDKDCYQLRLPDDAGHPRLEVRLFWENAESDLDFAVQGLWEGEQDGFALADQPGAGPEFAVTSAGFDGGSALWVWVIGYSGPPTNYTLDLVLR